MKLFGTAINYGFGDVEETGILIAVDEILEEKRIRHINSFIEDVIKIEKDAFADCTSLKEIEIPASVSQLLPSAGCTTLESIQVSKANLLMINIDSPRSRSSYP